MADFLGIEDVTIGRFAGQLLVSDEGYEVRPAHRCGDRSDVARAYLLPRGEYAHHECVTTHRKPSDLHRQFARRAQGKQGAMIAEIKEFATLFGFLNDVNP